MMAVVQRPKQLRIADADAIRWAGFLAWITTQDTAWLLCHVEGHSFPGMLDPETDFEEFETTGISTFEGDCRRGCGAHRYRIVDPGGYLDGARGSIQYAKPEYNFGHRLTREMLAYLRLEIKERRKQGRLIDDIPQKKKKKKEQ